MKTMLSILAALLVGGMIVVSLIGSSQSGDSANEDQVAQGNEAVATSTGQVVTASESLDVSDPMEVAGAKMTAAADDMTAAALVTIGEVLQQDGKQMQEDAESLLKSLGK